MQRAVQHVLLQWRPPSAQPEALSLSFGTLAFPHLFLALCLGTKGGFWCFISESPECGICVGQRVPCCTPLCPSVVGAFGE